MRRCFLRWAKAGVAVSLLTAGLSGCFLSDSMPDLPRTWDGGTAAGPDASITLRADGTGEFVNVPHGTGVVCLAAEPTLLNGEFTWHRVNIGLYVAEIEDSEVLFGPDSVFMGSVNWKKLVVQTCEGSEPGTLPQSVYWDFGS